MAKLSIFTASTPWLELKELVPAVKAAGFDGIEVGLNADTFDPSQPATCHGNNAAMLKYDNHLAEAEQLKALLDEHDLECSAIGSSVAIDDIDTIVKAVEVAKIVNCEFIRVRAAVYDPAIGYRSQLAEARACYRDLDQISAETGIDSLIEIHHRNICSSASAAMRVLEGLDPSHVGVIFDPANTIDEGFEDITMAIDLLGPFLRHVHCKDLKRVPNLNNKPTGAKWTGQVTTPGEGDLDWPAIIKLLSATDYDDWFVSENFADRDAGIAAIATDFAWLSSLVKG